MLRFDCCGAFGLTGKSSSNLPLHPNTKPTTVVLILCMVILSVLLLPLPFIAYKVLKFILSLGLL